MKIEVVAFVIKMRFIKVFFFFCGKQGKIIKTKENNGQFSMCI